MLQVFVCRVEGQAWQWRGSLSGVLLGAESLTFLRAGGLWCWIWLGYERQESVGNVTLFTHQKFSTTQDNQFKPLAPRHQIQCETPNIRKEARVMNREWNHFSHTHTHLANVLAFSLVKNPSSGNSSLPTLTLEFVCIVFRKSFDLSGPQFWILNPCLRIL
jgi:hypothetical protein